MNWANIKKGSLSAKLVLLFIVIAMIFVLVVGSSLRHVYKGHFKDKVRPHLTKYLEYVRDDIGLPADRDKAKQLADKLNISIVIVDSQGQWSSDNRYVNMDVAELEHRYTKEGVIYGSMDIGKEDYVTMIVDDTTFLFDLSRFKPERDKGKAFAPLLFLLIVLLLLYYAIRKLFSPILTIQEGVREIGSGNLNRRIQVTRNDELGVLAKDINVMADELQKMLDAKRQLLLAVSHELRSPLTRANVAVEMLEDSGLKQQIKLDIQEVNDLVGEILETERLNDNHQALDKTEQNLNELCTHLIHELVDAGDADTAFLHCHFPSQPITLSLDKTRIKLLLKNIISNAVRYKTQRVDVTLRQETNHVVLEVADDGQGVESELVPHLTEPFYRVDPSRQRETGGYGLGLYLCKVIAQAHGGRLEIHSQINKGTTVSLYLPLS